MKTTKQDVRALIAHLLANDILRKAYTCYKSGFTTGDGIDYYSTNMEDVVYQRTYWWSRTEVQRTLYVSPLFSGSNLDDQTIQLANKESIEQLLAEKGLPELHEAYGGHGSWEAVFTLRQIAALEDTFMGLVDYAVIDDGVHSEKVEEERESAWDSYHQREVRQMIESAIEAYFCNGMIVHLDGVIGDWDEFAKWQKYFSDIGQDDGHMDGGSGYYFDAKMTEQYVFHAIKEINLSDWRLCTHCDTVVKKEEHHTDTGRCSECQSKPA